MHPCWLLTQYRFQMFSWCRPWQTVARYPIQTQIESRDGHKCVGLLPSWCVRVCAVLQQHLGSLEGVGAAACEADDSHQGCDSEAGRDWVRVAPGALKTQI